MSDKEKPEPRANNGRFYSPEVKGRKKVGMLDWSLDELIAYKHNGTPPARIPDADLLYKLGAIGVSLVNAANLFDISVEKFSSNSDWHESWKKGRAECGARVRASIVEDALDKDILNAKLYLDKIMGGDAPADVVNVNVRNTTLETIDTDKLLEVMFKQDEPPAE